MSSSTFEQVRAIAGDLFSLPAASIKESSSPETIAQWDSTQHLNFVLALEEKFQFQLSPEEIEQMKNIGDIAKLVDARLQAAAR